MLLTIYVLPVYYLLTTGLLPTYVSHSLDWLLSTSELGETEYVPSYSPPNQVGSYNFVATTSVAYLPPLASSEAMLSLQVHKALSTSCSACGWCGVEWVEWEE